MITDDQREQALSTLAGRLFPAAEGMPSAADVLEPKQILSMLLGAWPDARGDVMRGLAALHASMDDLDAFRAREPDAWRALATGIAAAYYASAVVKTSTGYSGPSRRDPAVCESLEILLGPVVDRGPIWRPAP